MLTFAGCKRISDLTIVDCVLATTVLVIFKKAGLKRVGFFNYYDLRFIKINRLLSKVYNACGGLVKKTFDTTSSNTVFKINI